MLHKKHKEETFLCVVGISSDDHLCTTPHTQMFYGQILVNQAMQYILSQEFPLRLLVFS